MKSEYTLNYLDQLDKGKIIYTIHPDCVSYDLVVDIEGDSKLLNVQVSTTGESFRVATTDDEEIVIESLHNLFELKLTANVLTDEKEILDLKRNIERVIPNVKYKELS